MKPLAALGALDLRVASWGLMNPGISALVRLTTQLTRENACRDWRAAADILAYFLAIPNNQGTCILSATTNAIGLLRKFSRLQNSIPAKLTSASTYVPLNPCICRSASF